MHVTKKTMSALSYALLMGFVGLPMWWFTTDIIRYPLPFDKIKAFSDANINQQVFIELVSNEENIFKDFENQIKGSEIFKFQLKLRKMTAEEMQLDEKSKNVHGLDKVLPKSKESVVLFDTPKVGKVVAIGNHNTVYFSSAVHSTSVIMNAVREVILGENLIKHMISSIQDPNEAGNSMKWLLRKVSPSPEYDLLLTMLVPEPEILNVNWNIEKAVGNYLQPFLDEFGELADFAVKSQKIYLTGLGLKALKELKDGGGKVIGKIIKQEDLGLAINMESKLVSHVSSRKAFNFLAYIPTESQFPLYVEENDGKTLETNAFLVPRWGGVSIWNFNASEPGKTSFDDRYFMNIVITQLRLLLGLRENPKTGEGVKIVTLGDAPLRDWEKDFLYRMKIFEYLVTSRVTLQSLSDLLSKIVNIVITEDVAKDVIIAVDAYEKSNECMQKGNIRDCFKSAKLSFTSSEHAFFDNSLLALLYFPEDQKYAIYVPLFLPVLLSLYSCIAPATKELLNSFKTWKASKKAKSE